MPIIDDDEFGKITIRRSAKAKQVRIKLAPDGKLRASLPLYAPMFLIKRLLKNSRPQLRELMNSQKVETVFINGMQIGKSHSLIIHERNVNDLKISAVNQQIVAYLPLGRSINEPEYAMAMREAVARALRREAKGYLPRRLSFLAEKYSYEYENVRFSHASSRWGSCSTSGTISLNIALMKLPFELIDYVLIHELSHTREMNHSDTFWSLVEKGDPYYREHRKLLKTHSTNI